MKTCTRCDESKSLDSFSKWKSICKSCRSSANAARLRWRRENEPGYKQTQSVRSKEQRREYCLAHPEETKLASRREYEKHRESYILRANKWRDNNRAAVRQIKRRYKIKRKAWELNGSFTQREWGSLVEFYGNRCL